MRTALFLVLLITASQAFALGGAKTFGPSDCTLLNGVTFSTDRKTTTSGWNKALDTREYRSVSFQVWWSSLTGSLNGTCQIEVTNDPAFAESSWMGKSGPTFSFTTANGTDMISVTSKPEAYYRLNCAHGGINGGTLTARCFMQD